MVAYDEHRVERELFYWPGMNDHVKAFIQRCATCREVDPA